MRFPEFTGKWQVKKLGEVMEFKVTNSFSRENLNYDTGTVKNIHYGDIHTKFQTLFDITKEKVPYINNEISLSKISEDFYCKEGDVIFADASEDLSDIGKSIEILNLNNEKVLSGLHTLLGRPNVNYFQKGFNGYLFISNSVRSQIQKESQGTKVLSINVGRISRIGLSFPSLLEQAKIASFLSLIDERIAAQSKIIEAFNELKASLSKQIFSRKLRFKDENGNDFPEWVEKKLEYAVSQFIVPMRDKPQDLTGDIPWCRIEDFNGKHLYTSKSGQGVDISTVKKMNLKIYPIDTLLVSCSANLGVCAITKKELVTNQTFIGLVTNKAKIDVEYLYYIMTLSSIKLNTLSSGTTISYLSREEFEKFKIPYPCPHEQKKIANFLSNIDSKIEVETTIFDMLTKQKQYLLRQMFI